MAEDKFGLSQKEREEIISVFESVPAVKKVIIFGSRAIGNYKVGSDIDLAIVEPEINPESLIKLTVRLNEHTNLPYKFDLLNYDSISEQELKKHIDQYGKLFFCR